MNNKFKKIATAIALTQAISMSGCVKENTVDNENKFYDIIEENGKFYRVVDNRLTTVKTTTENEDGSYTTTYACPYGTTKEVGSGSDLQCFSTVYEAIPEEEIIDYSNGCLVLKDTCYKTNADGTIQEYGCQRIRCK